MSRVATGTYDAVIVSHSSFEKLPVSDETFGRFVGKQLGQLEEAIYEARAEKGDNRRIVKELEKAKKRKRLTTRLKERASRKKKDEAITWEQMGIAETYRQHGRMHEVRGVSRSAFLRINVNPVLRFLISKVSPQETQHFPAKCN
jgi:N12 class adenine-specific DNA methylase